MLGILNNMPQSMAVFGHRANHTGCEYSMQSLLAIGEVRGPLWERGGATLTIDLSTQSSVSDQCPVIHVVTTVLSGKKQVFSNSHRCTNSYIGRFVFHVDQTKPRVFAVRPVALVITMMPSPVRCAVASRVDSVEARSSLSLVCQRLCMVSGYHTRPR
jgi:hypothetical protein